MGHHAAFRAILALLVTFMSSAVADEVTPARKNVLFIAVDDLRPQISAYLDPDGPIQMHTPNIDQLAGSGTLFRRAYVQYSFCGPSRNSFLTGRRPDATQAFSFMDHFREEGVGDEWVSLPQYFRENDYWTVATGKLFHPGLPPSFDAQKSWDYFHYPGSCNGTTNGWPILAPGVTNVNCTAASSTCSNATGAVVAADSTGGQRWCELDESKLNAPLQDRQIASQAVSFLEEAKSKDKPFFIGVGFHKPHLPFTYPTEFNVYPESVAPPKHPYPPKGMPLCAWHEGNFANKWQRPCNHTSEYRRAYYSAVSFTDHNVGVVLSKLDELGMRDNTIVSFIGDHGWQLGELNEWRKMTNFELGTRVPLIIRDGMGKAQETLSFAEAVDLFPTLVSLAGLPKPPSNQVLQGSDLSAIIADGSASVKDYAFSQFAKRSTHSKELHSQELWDVCTTCNRTDIVVQGYSVRSNDWRYTEWVHWNKTTLRPNWSSVVGVELYNKTGDNMYSFDFATPTENVWNTSAYHQQVCANLSAVVRQQFQNDHLPPQQLPV